MLKSEVIRLNVIRVSKLFGSIDYKIDIPSGQPISIITAPNGCGKTTLLNLITFVLNPNIDNFECINSIPFSEMECVLSNGIRISLEKHNNQSLNEKNNNPHEIEKKMIKRRSLRRHFYEESYFSDVPFVVRRREIERRLEIYDKFMQSDSEYIYRVYNSKSKRNKNVCSFRKYLEDENTGELFDYLQSMLRESHWNGSINFVGTNRIIPVETSIDKPRLAYYDREQDTITVSPLYDAAEKVRMEIVAATEKYSQSLSSAKDLLPKMFLTGQKARNGEIEFQDFMNSWKTYREEIIKYQDIGLIKIGEDFIKNINERVFKTKGDFLRTYLEAFKDTTSPLKSIYQKLFLFKRIFDERNSNTNKSLIFNREQGVLIKSGGREVDIKYLSSGEKHDFIMFYNLIFNIPHGGLFLIDEPEISLHVEWQESFLDHLVSICEMNSLQAIVATHSPQILNGHFDYLVNMEGN